MLTQTSHMQPATSGENPEKVSLDKRLAILFWPLLLILLGTVWLFPAEQVPNGTLLIGIGLILVSLNAVRFVKGIPVRILPTLVGVLALVGGLAEYAGANLPLFPLTLIVIGASIVLELLPARKA